MKNIIVFAVIFLTLLLSSCIANTPNPTPAPTPTQTPSPLPSASSTPTNTPLPTSTSTLTSTPLPTPVGPMEIPANSEKGFEWPYLLYVPSRVSGRHILVVPNNTGNRDDDFTVHEKSAKNTLSSRISWASRLGVPLIVPIFPRFDDATDGTMASQYNGRGILENYWIKQYPLLAREDLQMVAMIDDAIQRLKELSINVDEKVFIEGYSASAMFASRFTILHPDRVQASVFGGHGWATVPTDKWKNLPLPYPYGTGDIETLTGEPFNLNEFKKVAIYVYMGEKDDSGWALPWYIGTGYNRSDYFLRFKKLVGLSAQEMSDSANEIYQSLECSATFVIFKNQNHMTAYSSHDSEILKFFQDHK